MFLYILTIISGIVFCFVPIYFWNMPWYYFPLTFLLGYFAMCLAFFLSAGVVAIILGRKKLTKKPKKIFNRYIVECTKFLVLFFRIKVIIEGEELVQGLEGYELVSNHQSNFDPICAIARIKRNDITYIMKKEIMSVPIVGRFLYSAAFYPLDRKNPREGLKTISYSSEAISEGRAIGLFIEGTRSKGPNLGAFHDGALKMAMKAKKEIVVCIVDNTYNIHKRFPFRRTKILIKYCKVYKYEDYQNYNTKDLGNEIWEIMDNSLKESRSKYNYYA